MILDGWGNSTDSNVSAVDKAIAPPDPPSPMIIEIIGVLILKLREIHEAIDSDCPRSSASFPGNAPGVSTNVITGKLNFSANFKRR